MKFLTEAKELLQNSGLMIGTRIYEFCEVEFYFHSPDHPDDYVHSHPEQFSCQKWCFQRASARPSAKYRGGTYKELDLSCGDGQYSYGGILIRAIYHTETGLISGPCNVVNHILNQLGVSSIVELVGQSEPLDVYNNQRGLYLVSLIPLKDDPLYVGPRVGLNPVKAPNWVNQPYRFCRRYSLIQKDKRRLTPII